MGAATAHSVFLQHAQPWPALAGIGDAHLGVLNQINVAPSLCSDPGHLLDPVEGAALDYEKVEALACILSRTLPGPISSPSFTMCSMRASGSMVRMVSSASSSPQAIPSPLA